MQLKKLSALNLLFVYLLAAVAVVVGINLHMKRQALHHAEEMASSILQRNLALHTYFNTTLKPAVFAALEKGNLPLEFDPRWMSSTYAVRRIDGLYRPYREEGYAYKESAINARNPDNEAEPHERDFLARAGADPGLTSETKIIELGGRPFFTFLHRGEAMERGCLRCHGEPDAAVPGLIDRYGRERGFWRHPGELVSAFSIRIPLAIPYREANTFSLQLSIVLIGILVALYIVQTRISGSLIFRPLDTLRERFDRVASTPTLLGDLVPEPRGEELAALTRAFNTLSTELRRQMDQLEETVVLRTFELEKTAERLQDDALLRRAVEEELRASRVLLLSFIESSPLPIVAYDLDGTISLWNRAAERAFGWTAAEVLRRPNPIVPPEDILEFNDLFTRIAQGEHLEGMEVARRRKDGSLVHLHAYSSAIAGPDGTPVAVMSILEDISERKEAEVALKTSEERFRTLFELAPDAYYMIDLEGTFIDGNRAAEEMLGVSREEMIGRNVFRLGLLPERDIPLATDRLTENAQGKETGPASFTLLRPDGRSLPIEVHTYPVTLEGKIHILGIARDISERLLSDRMLKEQQRQFQEMLLSIRMASVILDDRGRIVFINDFLLELTGYPRTDVIGKDWFNLFIPPEIRSQIRGIYLEMIRSRGFPPHYENEIVTAFGERRLVTWNNTVLRNVAGMIVGTASIGEDVTARRRIETHLRESQRQYRKLSQEFQTVLDGIPDSLVLLSADRQIVWANGSTATLLRTPESMAGRPCRILQSCNEKGCDQCPVDRALRRGEVESARIQGRDGRIWGIKAFPLRESDGQITQVIRWASDITEQVQVQEDAMRSARLASLGELAAGIAHEINNPNGLILLNSSLLRDLLADAEPLLEEQFRAQGDFTLAGLRYSRLREELPLILGETVDAAQRIRRIVEDLKNFARQDATDLSDDVDLNAALRTAVRLTKPILSKSTDLLHLELAEKLPTVQGSSQRIEQVIVNLLVNACQALPDRTRGITLTTWHDPERNRVGLKVRDEGAGIPPEILPQITNPFFTTRREVGGTGLGLAVSARIVKEHGGELRFDSRPGTGTSVSILLPVSKENSP